MAKEISPALKRSIRFNLSEVANALKAHNIEVTAEALGNLSFGSVLVILIQEGVALPIGAYQKPFANLPKQQNDERHDESPDSEE